MENLIADPYFEHLFVPKSNWFAFRGDGFS